MRILVADDDPVSHRRLESAVVRLGHEVVGVADGAEALAALLRPDGPRLAILDWMMPGLDGLEVCRAVRQRAAPYVYVILLTARDRREDMVSGLDAEADDFLTKPFDALELRARLRSGERVVELQEGLLRAQDALRVQATHDHLTGLWNRPMILDQLGREVHRCARGGGALTVVLADLDHFKLINDTYGHDAGDAVLKQAAERMRSELRDCDFLGRYGGEEFLLVLPGCDAAAATQVAGRVRARLAAEPLCAGKLRLAVSVSLGVATTSAPAAEPDALIKAADCALYRAKARGRNRVEAVAAA
ncbi:MAG TPA: diguanylate cyclase [Thermoanaerobaculia bacterium]|nr:diguanylate cyclase [Thermoanaerobaculia bacterium]